MICVTGDTHGRFERIGQWCRLMNTSKQDTLIILGDAGINYCLDALDDKVKENLSKLPITLLCVHGNNEQRPEAIDTYQEVERFGGIVYQEGRYPSLLFAKDGEIYQFGDKRAIVIGGASSPDKEYRQERGFPWFANEQPSEEIKAKVESRLEELDWKIDLVLSHTAPLTYEPQEAFVPCVDPDKLDKSTEQWLDEIQKKLTYEQWYCGHYHIQKKADKLRFMYLDFIRLC